MYRGFKSAVFLLSFSLLLSSPLQFIGGSLRMSLAQAQTSQDLTNEVKRLIQRGNQQLREGQFQAALKTFQEVVAIAKKIGNSQLEGLMLRNIGEVYQKLGLYKKALGNYQQALAIFQYLGNPAEEALALYFIGASYEGQGNNEQALNYYRLTLAISQEAGYRLGEGAGYTGLGRIYDSQGKYEEALEYYQQALEIDRKEGHRQNEGIDLEDIGGVYQQLGKYQQALEYYQQALRLFQEVDNPILESNTLNNIAKLYEIQSKYPQALSYYEKALKTRQNFDDSSLEEATLKALVEIYSKIASIYQRQGRFPEALKYYQQVLAQQRQQQVNDMELAETNNSLGESYAGQGQYKTALENYQQALKIYQEKGDRKNEAIVFNNIGLVYRNQGKYQQALYYCNLALAIFQQLEYREGEAKTLNNIASVYYSQGKYQQALDYHNQALAVFEEWGDRRSQAITFSNMGVVYEKLSQYQQALDYHQRALQIFEDLGDRAGINKAYNNIGLVYNSLRDYEEARNYFEKAAGISQEIGDQTGEATALNSIGKTYENQGKTKQAQKSYQQALEIYQQQENISGQAETLENVSSVSRKKGDYEQAQTYSEQALEINQQQGASIAEANTLNNLGELYASRNELKQAIDLYQRALKIYEEQGDIQGQIDTLNKIRLANSSLGNDELAEANLEQMLELARATGARVMEAAILKQLARDYENRGDKKTAQKLWEEAEKIEKDLDPDVVAAKAKTYELENNVKPASQSPETNSSPSAEKPKTANIEAKPEVEERSKYEQLLDKYESELEEKRKQKDKPGEAIALENLGSLQRRQRLYQDALDFYNEALEFQRELGDRQKEAELLNNIGETYRTQRRDNLAQQYFESALKIHQEEGDRAGEAATLNNLGLVYDSQGDDEKALEYFEQALEIFQELGYRSGEATVLNNMGGLYARLARNETLETDKAKLYDQALEFYQEALEIRKEIGERPGIGVTLNNIGDVYQSLGQFQLAKDYYQEAGVILVGTGNRESQAKSIGNLGALLEEQKQPELAIILLKQSININESIRQDLQTLPKELQETYAESIADRYRALAELLLRKDRPLEALRVIDLLKAQELEEYTRSVQGNEDTLTGIEILSLEQDIWEGYEEILQSANTVSSELNELSLIPETKRTPVQQSRFSELEKQEQKFQLQLNNYFQRNSVQKKVDTLAKKAKEQSLDLKYFDILQDQLGKLEQNGVLLYPLVLDDRIELIVSTLKKPPQRHTVNVKVEELNQVVKKFSTKLRVSDGDANTPGQELYNWLIKPIEKDFIDANVQTIIYAPDRQLRYIPLAALYDGKQWLIEKWRVNNITALSLTNLNKPPTQQPQVLAGAMSKSGRVELDAVHSFPPLDFIEEEVRQIKSIIPNTKIFINESFTRTNIEPQMSKYEIVHFATHGKFVDGQPESSFLLFNNNEIATLRNILEEWELKGVELVVLSACETALVHGDGLEILGLGYAVQKAGSMAAIATLRKVNDLSTKVLMTTFYEQLIDPNITTAEALRQAQIELIRRKCEHGNNECNHPYYWAAFLLIGNGL